VGQEVCAVYHQKELQGSKETVKVIESENGTGFWDWFTPMINHSSSAV
jgi:hypothetical protein